MARSPQVYEQKRREALRKKRIGEEAGEGCGEEAGARGKWRRLGAELIWSYTIDEVVDGALYYGIKKKWAQ